MNVRTRAPRTKFPFAVPRRTVRAVLAEPHTDTRIQLGTLLSQFPEVEVSGMSATLREALEQISALSPELVILDWHLLPSPAVWRALALPPHTLIVTAQDGLHAAHAYELGATDYLLKPFDAAQLEAAVARALLPNALLASHARN